MKKIFALWALTTAASLCSVAQEYPEIRIKVSKSQFDRLLASKGEKVELKDPILEINGIAANVKDIHSRGNNSLTFKHKSLAIDLESHVTLSIDGEKTKLKKFDLLNLVMDKNLWHNRWAFLHMKELGFFPLINAFCTLWINDQPQGIFLLVEKPSALVTRIKSPYMLRRGINHLVDDEYFEDADKEAAKGFRSQYKQIYDKSGKLKGEALLGQLQDWLVLDHYFDWLAFNYLIMNGDYADEVFLYVPEGTRRFDVLPWDYDDILRPSPHEGNQARNAVTDFRTKLIFSSEDPLDRAIAGDAVVYEAYLKELKVVLNALTQEKITAITDKVRKELKAVSESKESADATFFLDKEKFEYTKAEEDIKVGLEFILRRRIGLLSSLQ